MQEIQRVPQNEVLGYVRLAYTTFRNTLDDTGDNRPICSRYSRSNSAFDFPLAALGAGRESTGVVALDDGRVGGGGAREGRKDEAIGVGVGVDAREYRN